MQETGPTIYSPYPGSLEPLTIQRHILFTYFKTLSVGPVWGSDPRPSHTANLRSTQPGGGEYNGDVDND